MVFDTAAFEANFNSFEHFLKMCLKWVKTTTVPTTKHYGENGGQGFGGGGLKTRNLSSWKMRNLGSAASELNK